MDQLSGNTRHPVTAIEALQRLRDGNRRFAAGEVLRSSARREDLLAGQTPFAIVLGCSDSRVPAEFVFDQGLGDLFVIRIAGNVVAPSGIGSVEFAVERFGTRLVVVLGHSRCGAVAATIECLRDPAAPASRHLRSIVERIRPSVEPLLDTDLERDADALIRRAVRANVRVSASHLRSGSELLEDRMARGDLLILGAEYALESGEVYFFDGLPQ